MGQQQSQPQGIRRVDIAWKDRVIAFQCFDNPLSLHVAHDIFAGKTYRPIPYVRNVRAIVDIGANIGATSVFLHTHYPEARIVAVEPSAAAFALLRQNTSPFPQIELRQTALYSKKASLPLRRGTLDSVTNSFGNSVLAGKEGETLELEDAAAFFLREGLQEADIVKLDTEGCEWPILSTLRPWLGRFRVIYLEYHSETDRRRIDVLLEPTHLLHGGAIMNVHRGELCYVSRAAMPAEGAEASLEIKAPEV